MIYYLPLLISAFFLELMVHIVLIVYTYVLTVSQRIKDLLHCKRFASLYFKLILCSTEISLLATHMRRFVKAVRGL